MPGKPKILVVLHKLYNRGGTEEHVRDLCTGLKDRYEIAVLFRERDTIGLIDPQGEPTFLPGEIPVWPVAPFLSHNSNAALREALSRIQPDLIHIQHLIDWPLGTAQQLLEVGKPVILSLHDYFIITPVFTLQGSQDPTDCFSPTYSQRIFGKDYTEYLTRRRTYFSEILGQVKARIVPSSYLAEQLRSVYPFEYRSIELGIKPFVPLPRIPEPGRIRFGYFGSLIPQKGFRTLLQAFSALHTRYPHTSLDIFGGRLERDPPGVRSHGVYDQPLLPKLLAGVDIGVIPSEFRETYCLVLSEMWQAGLPVAAARIGTLGERIQDGVNGKLYEAGNVSALESCLESFLTTDTWRNWRLPQPRQLSAMITDFDALYQEIL